MDLVTISYRPPKSLVLLPSFVVWSWYVIKEVRTFMPLLKLWNFYMKIEWPACLIMERFWTMLNGQYTFMNIWSEVLCNIGDLRQMQLLTLWEFKLREKFTFTAHNRVFVCMENYLGLLDLDDWPGYSDENCIRFTSVIECLLTWGFLRYFVCFGQIIGGTGWDWKLFVQSGVKLLQWPDDSLNITQFRGEFPFCIGSFGLSV